MKRDDLIIVRGGGDLATGTIHRLWAAGLRVLVLEIENPAAIRRQVALCEAVYTKTTEVEGLRAVRIDRYEEAEAVWQENSVPILIDPKGVSIGALKPAVVIDAILAKRNLGTRRDMAPLTIALGPGFTAGEDVDVVVETKRGHRLGRIIREGAAIPNTGIPGVIGGYGAERVIHAQAAGIFKNVRVIGDIVEAGDTIAEIWQDGRNENSGSDTDHGHSARPFAGGLSGDGTFQGSRCRSEKRGTFQLFSDLGQGEMYRGKCTGVGVCPVMEVKERL